MRMKVRVLKPFRDIHTGERYRRGQIIEVTKKRLAEIQKNLGGGFAEAVPKSSGEEPEQKAGG